MSQSSLFCKLKEKIEQSVPLSADEGLEILTLGRESFIDLLSLTDRLRRRNFGGEIHLCSIVNAKSGLCGEDCAFCAQSVHYQAGAEEYDLLPPEKLKEAYDEAQELPISHFGFVTSGGRLEEADLEQLVELFESNEKKNPAYCSSLGALDEQELRRLKQAGMKRFHHNLETAPSFFDEICSTHDIEQRIETVRTAKKVGLEVCSGGLIGLGEELEQRVELALTLRRLDVDAIPLNFVIPVENTPIENLQPPEPFEILKTIAAFRLLNPEKEIKLCAGRKHLRDLQSYIFHAGATGMMIGDLLTVAGRSTEKDLQMLEDFGFDVRP